MPQLEIPTYIDFKSPYAYLAVRPTRAMAVEYDLKIDWRPYNLPIAEYLGDVDARNEHQWRRVKYSYMDVRRLANQRGLTVLGPRKVYNSTIASIGLLHAKNTGVADAYIDEVFEQFFKRQLDIEDAKAIAAVLANLGVSATSFQTFLSGAGPAAFTQLMDEAHELGVFGTPSYLLDGELYWGNERLELLTERLRARS